jgi:hypothetical protein
MSISCLRDTGKEREETYTFVRECGDRWGVEVHWVHREGYFDKLIEDKKALPNCLIASAGIDPSFTELLDDKYVGVQG